MGLTALLDKGIHKLAVRKLHHDAEDFEKRRELTQAANTYRTLSTHTDDPNKKADHLLHAGELYARAEVYDAAKDMVTETGALSMQGLNAVNDHRLRTLRSNIARYVL